MAIISDGRIIIDTEIDSSGAESDAKSLSGKLEGIASKTLGTVSKITAGMVTAATGAVAVLTKLSIEQYAEYEQLVGGVETLFKNSSDKVMDYANNAYQSAGMSANEYMNTITGFAASLLQGLGGDTEKAAQIGNLAVTDMADNANKMGTAIENIQNAYQGFAKQNYTMLDNLKLGYGGTKAEMERLLADAEKLTGIKYDISNFSDIIEAIHIIQNEMGITGTTAKEAASTIEGSLNMTKSAWTNLLTGMADDNANFDVLVDNLVNSMGALGENLLPRIEIAINGIGQLIDKLLPPIIDKLPGLITSILPGMLEAGVNVVSSLGNGILESLPTIIDLGIQVIESLIEGIQANLPTIATGAINIITSLVEAIMGVLPTILELGLQLLITLGQGIAQSLPSMIPVIVNTIMSLYNMFVDNLPLIIDTGIEILLALVEGIINALPILIQEVPRIINGFSNAIYEKLPDILKAGIEIIVMLVKGLIDSIPIIIQNLPQIIMAIVNVFTLMNWASIGKNLITSIGSGISSMVGNIGSIARGVAESVVNGIKGIFTSGGSIGRNLISFISNGISSMLSGIVTVAKSIGTSVINVFKNIFSMSSMAEIGKNLIKGIWNGISNMTGWIINLIGGFADSVVSSIKGFFGIHSPSRVMRDLIGVNLVKGIGVGVDIETPYLEKDIDTNMADLVAKMEATVDYERVRSIPARVINYQTINNTNNTNSNNSESLVDAIKELAGRPINLKAPDGSTIVSYIIDDLEPVMGRRLALAIRGCR